MRTIPTSITKRSAILAIGLVLVSGLFLYTRPVAAETTSTDAQGQIALLQKLIKTLQERLAVLLNGSAAENKSGHDHALHVGHTVGTTDTLKVRGNPSVSGDLLAVLKPNTRGSVVDGPKSADGYVWWKIAYPSVTGWSAANWLKADEHAEEPGTVAADDGPDNDTPKHEHKDEDTGDAPPGTVWIGENASQNARTLPNSKTVATSAPFIELFTGNTGKVNFRFGVFHAGVGFQELGYPARIWGDGNAQNGHGGHWTADHDMNCGTPATQRPLSSSASDFNIDEIFFLCKDHIMSSMGDVDGYSIAWFSPKNSFSRATHKTVSWDVNVTDLFGRQWWEVAIVPKGGHVVATIEWNSRGDLLPYDNASVIIGNGPFGGGVNMITKGENHYEDWRPICDGDFALDPVGCKDKMIRRPFSVIDNGNGTLTVNYAGLYTQTIPGKFPEEFDIYFTDHNYTPDKDGKPVGHTWHWDSIRVE